MKVYCIYEIRMQYLPGIIQYKELSQVRYTTGKVGEKYIHSLELKVNES